MTGAKSAPCQFASRRQALGESAMLLKRASLLVGALFLVASQAIAGTSSPAETVWPTKGWEVSTPEAQGMDSAALARLADAGGARRRHSLLIARPGRTVAHAYSAPFQPRG